jgi:LysM repeat protein
MKNRLLVRASLGAVTAALTLAALLVASVARAQGQPLFSETFDSAFANDPYCKQGDCKVPGGWGVWFIPRTENDLPGVNFQPKYDQTTQPNRVHSGSGAQRIWADNATFTGGIYRVINDAPVGGKLRLTAWGQVWSTNDESPISARPSRDIKLKIGVDPLGGNNGSPSPLNGQVVWSPEQDPKDAYAQFSVEVDVKSPTIIVYTYATMRDNVRHNEVFWDDVVLETIAPPPTATPDAATVAAAITSTAPLTEAALAAAAITTPTAESLAATGAITYVIKEGDTLFGISLDQNVPLEDLLANNPGVRAETLQIGQELVIKPASAAPTAAPAPVQAEQPTPDPVQATAIAAGLPITSTPTVGEACVQAFFDDDGDGKRDDNEDLVPNILFTVSADGAQVGSYTSTGVDEPYCFDNLPNKSYTVAAAALDIYVPTTPLNDTLNVNGARSFLSVGLRREADGSVDVSKAPEPEQASSDGPNWGAILSVAGGALLLVGAVGFGATVFLRRRRL